MADVFFYNSGSLLQALNPAESIVDLAGDPMLDNVVDAFIPTVSQGEGVYGVPVGTGMGGGILYRTDIFEEHGLSVPLTWEEFAANNDALLEAGVTPVGASFGTTWTSQLFVLADYYNVAQEVPDFAEQYTANEAHYADTPAALRSFERLQEAYDSGWWNEDYGSAIFEDALQMLVDGEIAQYPMLTFAMSQVNVLDPEAAQNIGFFAQPGESADTNGMTLWMPQGAYIAATTDQEEVARAFLAFIASVEGTEAQTAAATPSGPYLIEGATLPDDVLPVVLDIQEYIDAGNVGPRSSSSRRSRARASSKSPSRSAPACAAPKTPPRCMTRTSPSRRNNSACQAGDGDSSHHQSEPGGTWADDGPGPVQPDLRDPPTNDRQTSAYPHWFYIPVGIVFVAIFVVPTAMAFFYSFTRWTLFDWEFIGLDNFRQFFREPALTNGLRNTFTYAVVTSGLKVVLGMALAMLVTSRLRLKGTIRSIVFFPVLVSFVAVGITFKVMMHPTKGLINRTIEVIGFTGPKWLTDPQIALLSVALVDVWKGVGLATVIFIAGIVSIPSELLESVSVDGGSAWARFRHVILPLSKPATFTVILLSFIGGLRSFDLIWTMTGGGPGFTTDVLASTIYKNYQAGFYGLSTAGNVILFLLVTAIVFPLNWFLRKRELTS